MIWLNRIQIPAKTEHLQSVRSFIEKAVRKAGITEERAHPFLMAVDEAIANIALYGYPDDERQKKDHYKIKVCYRLKKNVLEVIVEDKSFHYNPLENICMKPEDSIDSMSTRGRGLYAIQNFPDEVCDHALKKGNRLILRIYRS